MGYYYDRPPNEEKPPGCLDVLLITRAVFAVIMIPVGILFGVFFFLSAAFYLFTFHAALGLIPIGVLIAAVWLFARWEQRRARPPE
ncbi:MAG TPA: hypothetical protein VIH21_07400 [Dehalococcoidia bacterium]